MIWPTSSGRESVRASRRFGAARPGHKHRGIDLGGPGGRVLAAESGTVSGVWLDKLGPGSVRPVAGMVPDAGTGGLWCELEHVTLKTRYMHLGACWVQPGTSVAAGQVIGTVGRSGFAAGSATVDHLHFEILDRASGHARDPLPYLLDELQPVAGLWVGFAVVAGLLLCVACGVFS